MAVGLPGIPDVISGKAAATILREPEEQGNLRLPGLVPLQRTASRPDHPPRSVPLDLNSEKPRIDRTRRPDHRRRQQVVGHASTRLQAVLILRVTPRIPGVTRVMSRFAAELSTRLLLTCRIAVKAVSLIETSCIPSHLLGHLGSRPVITVQSHVTDD